MKLFHIFRSFFTHLVKFHHAMFNKQHYAFIGNAC